jgi:elongation factor Ts
MTITITADQVRQLREQTGAGMMECKKALSESGGDFQKAIDALRKSGIAKAEKRGERVASEGVVDSYIHPGNRVGVLVEVNCETDFVARTDEFKELVRNIAMQGAAAGADYLRREQVPAERVEKEREIFAAQLALEGKPAQMIEKIVDGKINKYYSEICLLEQPYIKDDKIKVQDLVTQAAAKTGENIQVRRFVRFRLGQD